MSMACFLPPLASLRVTSGSSRFLACGRKRWSSCCGAQRVRCACTASPRNWGDGHSVVIESNGNEDRFPSEMSDGMKKRVALARSIIFDKTRETIEPEVLLYDEPTAGLDPIASTVVENLIRSVHLSGNDALEKPGKITSYVVVTHQHSTIRRAVDRLLFLYDGKIIWEGMTHEFTNSTNPIVQQFASGSLDGPIKY